MSDDATKSVKVEEPTSAETAETTTEPTTEVAAEPATITSTDDTTVPDATVKPDEVAVETEGGDVKTEGGVKAESGNGEDVNKDIKQETGGKKENGNVMKTTAKHNYSNPRSNNKFDPSLAPVTDDPAKMPAQIRTQVEFYLGNSNLPQDKFLWNKTGGTQNRPVPLSVICSFGRMRNFKPYEAVVDALKESKFLVLSGEPGQELVARREPYAPFKRGDLVARSVYAKGFGDEKPSTQFDIEAFFARFETANAIRLRRTPEGLFKGSVYVEFENAEQAQAFLALDPPPKWQGSDLKIMSKKDYMAEKDQLINEGKLKPTESNKRSFWGPSEDQFNGNAPGGRGGRVGRGDRGRGRGRGGSRGRGGRDRRNGGDPDDWKSRKAEDRHRGRGRRDRNEERADNNDESGSANKRDREDDAADGQPAAKKVDTKTESDVKVEAPVTAEE